MKKPVFGIDLGTTNSVLAWLRDGRPEVISHAGETLLPSVVGFDFGGELLVGTAAKNQLVAFPDRTVASIKRRMGSDQVTRLGDRAFSPPEISALILAELARRGRAVTGIPVEQVVITVPAFFQDAQRAATRLAGELAGLEVVRLLNEPTAAALAFEGADRERTLLVYDLGGGTFDCSIVVTDGRLTEVLASHGDVLLGGDDFDRLLAELLVRGLPGDPMADTSTRYRLLRAAELAKCKLTEEVEVAVREEFLTGGTSPVHLDRVVERSELEQLIEPLLERTFDSVHKALEMAGRSLAQIDDILLVGGQTRTPMVARRLHAITGKLPRRDVHPDLCVALGAAIAGAQHSGERTDRVLVDVTAYSYGTSHLGDLDGQVSKDCYLAILERGTPLPAVRSETFFTVVDDQEQIDVRIFQGESPDARDNILIGQFSVDVLSPAPAGSPIVFRMSLGLDGILHVEVTERATGKQKKVRIDSGSRQESSEQIGASRTRLLGLVRGGPDATDDDGEGTAAAASDAPEQAEWITELRLLMARARVLLERLAAEDRHDLEGLLGEAEDTIARLDTTSVGAVRTAIEDLIHYAEGS